MWKQNYTHLNRIYDYIALFIHVYHNIVLVNWTVLIVLFYHKFYACILAILESSVEKVWIGFKITLQLTLYFSLSSNPSSKQMSGIKWKMECWFDVHRCFLALIVINLFRLWGKCDIYNIKYLDIIIIIESFLDFLYIASSHKNININA